MTVCYFKKAKVLLKNWHFFFTGLYQLTSPQGKFFMFVLGLLLNL